MAEPKRLIRITNESNRADIEEAITTLRARRSGLTDPVDIEANQLTIDELLEAWPTAPPPDTRDYDGA